MQDPSSRRQFLKQAGLASVAISTSQLSAEAGQATASPADDIVARLLEGNARYMQGKASHPRRMPADFAPLAEEQKPVAVIVGCADSRVSPELIFDQGVGDLFVVRIAGNVITGAGASVKGSIEYAVAELGVKLIMVLGHTQCGAVKAAIKHIDAQDDLPGSIGDLVNTIKPAANAARSKPGDQLTNVIHENVSRGVDRLKSLEPILAGEVKRGAIKVVGATYDLKTGKVALLA